MTELNEDIKKKLETLLGDIDIHISVCDHFLAKRPTRREEVRLYSKVKKGPSHSVKEAYVSTLPEIGARKQVYVDIRERIYREFPELREQK